MSKSKAKRQNNAFGSNASINANETMKKKMNFYDEFNRSNNGVIICSGMGNEFFENEKGSKEYKARMTEIQKKAFTFAIFYRSLAACKFDVDGKCHYVHVILQINNEEQQVVIDRNGIATIMPTYPNSGMSFDYSFVIHNIETLKRERFVFNGYSFNVTRKGEGYKFEKQFIHEGNRVRVISDKTELIKRYGKEGEKLDAVLITTI